ncbi:ExbD/TolR family protein [Prevotella sp.]|uniref:ExbD/TolR family protein n=1 Tax=Prevotella sp. TaxID=59823 RepID=UPI002F9432E6
MFKKRIRQVPGLNTTSTADISFMLLIFFLVASSMNVDKGLMRQLPPMETKPEQQKPTEIDRKQLLRLSITADNRLLMDEKPVAMDKLRQHLDVFLTQRGSRHMIMIESDPGADYDVYFRLQNALVAAFQHWREQAALKTYGRNFRKLTSAERDHVRELCPQRIYESYDTAQKGGNQ